MKNLRIASAFRPRGRFEWEVKIHFGEKVVLGLIIGSNIQLGLVMELWNCIFSNPLSALGAYFSMLFGYILYRFPQFIDQPRKNSLKHFWRLVNKLTTGKLNKITISIQFCTQMRSARFFV